MRPLNVLALIFTLIFMFTINSNGLNAASPGWNNGKIKWMSFQKGMQKAKATGKPALVVFEAKWCKICKQYRKLFYNKQVVAMSKNMVMVMVNIEKNRELQKQYSIDGGYIPRTMAFSPKGYHDQGLTGTDHEFKYYINPHSASDLLRFMKKTANLAN